MNEKDALPSAVDGENPVRTVATLGWVMENKGKGLGDLRGVQAFDACTYGCRYWENDFLGCPDHDPMIKP